jgi:hypothetical protein
MKITKKQQEEIAFLKKHFRANPDEKEIEEYIGWTVQGEKGNKDGKRDNNSLFQAKRRLDMTIKMWAEDMKEGILGYWELEEDLGCPYFNKILLTIRKKLSTKPFYDGDATIAKIAWLNSKHNL